MKKYLPQYNVNCFMKSGYDTIDVMSEIINETISQIENYVDELKDALQERIRSEKPASYRSTFRFPPGDEIRILKYVKKLSMKPESDATSNHTATKPPS
uniref:Uncharacterized protein n=1 Tax=Amphimedon queenslandica TaxID=400682 RepID=A0A1X7U6R3_AMPQE